MSIERYRQVFEHCPVAALALNRDGQIADCNRVVATTLHRGRDELIGTPVLKWIRPEDRDRSRGAFMEALRGIARDWSVMIQRGDGLIRRFELCARGLGEEGEPDEVLVFVTPATGEERASPELLRLAPLLKNLPGQFAVILDTEARIRYSSGLARTHWQDDGEWVGRDFGALLSATEHSREGFAALRRELAEGRPWSGVLWHARADGTSFPAETFAVASHDPRTQQVIGALLAGRDASAEHDARRVADESQRLARVGELVIGVARELKTPLEAAASALTGPHPDGAGARVALDRAQALLRALAGFAGEAEPTGEAAPLRAGLEAAVTAVMARAPAPAPELSLKAADDLPAVYVEATALQRVFEEILTNALEAVGGRPLPRIVVEALPMPASVLVRIHDNGAGLSGQSPEKIFDPFFTTRPGHLGLGLPTARRIVEASGGRIWVDRSQSGWTTLSLELPREPATGGAAFRPVPLVISRARNLLLVDDDQGVRAMLKQLLERVGFHVSEAWSGRSALAQLTSGGEFQVVLTDLRMNDGTGYWLLTELRKDFPALLRRTVIMTGDPSLAAVEKIARDTGCAVVRKPFDFRRLLETLDEAAGRGA